MIRNWQALFSAAKPPRTQRSARSARATLFAGLLLAGCSSNALLSFDEKELGQLTPQDLCAGYYLHRTEPPRYGALYETARQQLEARLQALGTNREELDAIRNQRLQKGMSECALLAAWGPPDFRAITEDRVAHWVRYDYHPAPDGRSTRVYLSEGRVAHWMPVATGEPVTPW